MDKSLEERRKKYAKQGHSCYYCGCDLSKSENYEGHGVHIYKVSGLVVYVCFRCHEERQK